MARNRDCQAANYAKRGLITARRPAVRCVGLVVCRVVWTAPDRGNLHAAISVADAVVMGGRMRSLGDPAAHEVTLRCDRAGSLANGGTCSGDRRANL